MARLRPRDAKERCCSVFSNAEVGKMESLIRLPREKLLNKEFCEKLVRNFNRLTGRTGKIVLNWMQVQSWFQNRLQETSTRMSALARNFPHLRANEGRQLTEGCMQETSKQMSALARNFPQPRANEGRHSTEEELARLISEMEFEAKSSEDGAWYDVDTFIAHRVNSAGATEACVRFIGFGAEHDEWVNVKEALRLRSIPLEHTECHKVKVGDVILCFQEREDQAIYYDADVIKIQKKGHDIRGCRCLFTIRYLHDKTEEEVHLRRLCRRQVV